MALRVWSLALALLLSVGCQDRNGEAVDAGEAREITNAYLAEKLPQVNLAKEKIDTLDMGDTWRVVYSVPGGGTGGPIIFIVDKRSGEIVGGEMSQ